MNQSILFSDIQSWDDERRGIRFSAQQSGMLIECFTPLTAIEKLSGKRILSTKTISSIKTIEEEQQALSLFTQYRFELEELAESMIEDEDYDSNGQIVVTF